MPTAISQLQLVVNTPVHSKSLARFVVGHELVLCRYPGQPDGSPLTDWQSVSVGRVHTCGIRAGGVLTCFGANADGQLDLIHSSSRFITVSAGGYHTCAVDDVYRVHCVGRDDYGQVSLLNGLSTRIGSAQTIVQRRSTRNKRMRTIISLVIFANERQRYPEQEAPPSTQNRAQ